MTTIAWDGKCLAADQLIVEGNTLIGYAPKIIGIPRVGWVTGVGSANDISAFFDWVKKGRMDCEKPEMSNEFLGVMITKNGDVIEYEDKLHGWTLPPGTYAWGAGDIFALAALRLGKTAKEAVQFAIDNTIDSGGVPDVVRIVT